MEALGGFTEARSVKALYRTNMDRLECDKNVKHEQNKLWRKVWSESTRCSYQMLSNTIFSRNNVVYFYFKETD